MLTNSQSLFPANPTKDFNCPTKAKLVQPHSNLSQSPGSTMKHELELIVDVVATPQER